MLECLESPHKASQNLRILPTLKVMRFTMRSGMQRLEHLFRGLCKDVFNRVRNHKHAHSLWSDIFVLHEGTKSEREERYHLVKKKLNSFEMLPSENINEMY